MYNHSSLLANKRLMLWIQDRLDTVTDKFDKAAGHEVDIYRLGASFALDIVSFMVSGNSFRLLEGQKPELLESIQTTVVAGLSVIRWPSIVVLLSKPLFRWFKPDYLQKSADGGAVIEREVKNLYSGSVAHVKGGEDVPVISAANFMEHDRSYGKDLTNAHVLSEVCDHVSAGKMSSPNYIVRDTDTKSQAVTPRQQLSHTPSTSCPFRSIGIIKTGSEKNSLVFLYP